MLDVNYLLSARTGQQCDSKITVHSLIPKEQMPHNSVKTDLSGSDVQDSFEWDTGLASMKYFPSTILLSLCTTRA